MGGTVDNSYVFGDVKQHSLWVGMHKPHYIERIYEVEV